MLFGTNGIEILVEVFDRPQPPVKRNRDTCAGCPGTGFAFPFELAIVLSEKRISQPLLTIVALEATDRISLNPRRREVFDTCTGIVAFESEPLNILLIEEFNRTAGILDALSEFCNISLTRCSGGFD